MAQWLQTLAAQDSRLTVGGQNQLIKIVLLHPHAYPRMYAPTLTNIHQTHIK